MSGKYTGRQRAKNSRYKLDIDYANVPNHGINELTDKSPRPAIVPNTVEREAVASLYCDKGSGKKWVVRFVGSDKPVATLSLRRERLCYKIWPGMPGADGVMHTVNSKHRKDGLKAIARKIGGFQVEVPA